MPTATHTLLQMDFNLQGQRLSAAAAWALQGRLSGMPSCKHDCFQGMDVCSMVPGYEIPRTGRCMTQANQQSQAGTQSITSNQTIQGCCSCDLDSQQHLGCSCWPHPRYEHQSCSCRWMQTHAPSQSGTYLNGAEGLGQEILQLG